MKMPSLDLGRVAPTDAHQQHMQHPSVLPSRIPLLPPPPIYIYATATAALDRIYRSSSHRFALQTTILHE